MKAELQTEEVLAMYDVRGIQKFIFKTNVAKEIIGASKLVDQIITQGIISYLEKNVPEDSILLNGKRMIRLHFWIRMRYRCRFCLSGEEMPMYYFVKERYVRR